MARKRGTRTCRKKAEKGNLYWLEEQAQRAADDMKGKGKSARIFPYLCPICSHWHLGKISRRDWLKILKQKENPSSS